MRWSVAWWCFCVALAIVVPVGLRVLTRSQEPVGPRVLTLSQEETRTAALEDIQAGQMLFVHEWLPDDPLAGGDGLGPVYNATSCAACHRQGDVGGGGGLEHNVTIFTGPLGNGAIRPKQFSRPVRGVQTPSVLAHKPETTRFNTRLLIFVGVIHAHAIQASFQETLANIDSHLPALSRPTLLRQWMGKQPKRYPRQRHKLLREVHLTQRNTPALFGAGLIDSIPDQVILANARSQGLGRPSCVARVRIGKFGWKAQAASLGDFVQAACANELGLSNPGHAQPQPLGRPDYQTVGLDLTQKQCDQLTAFIASLRQPEERRPADPDARSSAARGKTLFNAIGCAACHTARLGSVSGIYSDLLLHRMGKDLEDSGSAYGAKGSPSGGPQPEEWRTPPLWGVADSAPYLHDGRAATLEDAIRMHGGQGARAADRFAQQGSQEQADLIEFLKTLRAPSARNTD